MTATTPKLAVVAVDDRYVAVRTPEGVRSVAWGVLRAAAAQPDAELAAAYSAVLADAEYRVRVYRSLDENEARIAAKAAATETRSLPNGRVARKVAGGWEAQPAGDNYWVTYPTLWAAVAAATRRA